MTLDQLDEKTIFHGVYRTLEKHKNIPGFAAAVTADLTILNLKYAPGRSETSMEVLKRHFDRGLL